MTKPKTWDEVELFQKNDKIAIRFLQIYKEIDSFGGSLHLTSKDAGEQVSQLADDFYGIYVKLREKEDATSWRAGDITGVGVEDDGKLFAELQNSIPDVKISPPHIKRNRFGSEEYVARAHERAVQELTEI